MSTWKRFMRSALTVTGSVGEWCFIFVRERNCLFFLHCMCFVLFSVRKLAAGHSLSLSISERPHSISEGTHSISERTHSISERTHSISERTHSICELTAGHSTVAQAVAPLFQTFFLFSFFSGAYNRCWILS